MTAEPSAAALDAIVIGAGVAGLAAAVRLAESGRRVVVLEESPRLGGRATAFTDRATGERVDNGQHVLFGCYRETYAMLQRIGSAHLAPLQRGLTLSMFDRDGRSFNLRCPALPPPWHLAVGLMRWRALSTRDRLSALRLRRVLDDARRRGARAVAAEVPPGETVAAWLQRHGQTANLRRWLWDPLTVAALNQSPDEAAAAPFVRVLGELFGPRAADASVGLPAAPLDELFAEPARRLIEGRSGSVLLKSSARVLSREHGMWRVRAGGREFAAASVVSAVPWHAFHRLWDNAPPPELSAIAAHAQAMTSQPIVTVNLWLDGPVLDAPFAGFVDDALHWVFDKRALFGERGGHLSIVASGATALVGLDNEALTRAAVDQLTRTLPAMRKRTVQRSVVVREPRATFSVAPGGPPRPAARTPLPGFYLAGDWTDTGLPGTIESAAESGHRAAACVMAEPLPGSPSTAIRAPRAASGA